jgi:hypothetical protein
MDGLGVFLWMGMKGPILLPIQVSGSQVAPARPARLLLCLEYRHKPRKTKVTVKTK